MSATDTVEIGPCVGGCGAEGPVPWGQNNRMITGVFGTIDRTAQVLETLTPPLTIRPDVTRRRLMPKSIPILSESAISRFWSRVDIRDPQECWEWQGACWASGYGQFKVKKQRYRAHRVAFVIAGGELGQGTVVRHRCDNRRCVNPSHLEPGTHEDNMADMQKRGRASHGTRHARSRFSEDDVIAMRSAYSYGEPVAEIAARFGVGPAVLNNLLFHAWKHLPIPDRRQRARGERAGCSKLTPEKVRAIRALLSKGVGVKAIAEQFGVRYQSIQAIRDGRTWLHV